MRFWTHCRPDRTARPRGSRSRPEGTAVVPTRSFRSPNLDGAA
jgi:hypothetical protein